MSLIHNERTKLFASAMSNTAVATFVTAIIAPIAGLLYGTPMPQRASGGQFSEALGFLWPSSYMYWHKSFSGGFGNDRASGLPADRPVCGARRLRGGRLRFP